MLRFISMHTRLILLVVVLGVTAGVFFLIFAAQKRENPVFTHSTEILIGQTKVIAALADTPELREKGLSGQASLAEGEGMLFIFPKSGTYGFWMKDMRFPIDIIWIDAEKKILGIEKDISPGSFPTVFYPPAPASYVLEVPAGVSAFHGITEQNSLTLFEGSPEGGAS